MVLPTKSALSALTATWILAAGIWAADTKAGDPADPPDQFIRLERPNDEPADLTALPAVGSARPPVPVLRDGFVHVQVNVNADGDDILDDAANEPSIAVDPNNPMRIAIGWRQFDHISSDFRQAGVGYSTDGGLSWTFPGVLQPGEFSSDPVLDFDAEGNFYYYALQPNRGPGQWACYLYKSTDGGVTWPVDNYAYGGDKGWITVDRTDGIGSGNIYAAWSYVAGCCGDDLFNRSTDGGVTFSYPVPIPQSPRWGTLTVGTDGEVYLVGTVASGGFAVCRSTDAQDPDQTPTFDQDVSVDLGGSIVFGGGPNPGGLLGQVWIACNHAPGPDFGNLYVLASVNPPGADPLDVMFTRSTDGGLTWSPPVRINDDPTDNGAWQWFGTMSVAPNGRIDVVWNDTRNDPEVTFSELYYCSSQDGGLTWSENVPASPPFSHFDGYPSQNKLGDYYDMISDNVGAHLAWAATFTGGQDVYYVRIGAFDCNGNGIPDGDDIAAGTSNDCTTNGIPDECEPDCDTNGTADSCDIAAGTADDCNTNAIPDTCDIVVGRSNDCNTNNIPDECETDCNDNQFPDDCDVAAGTSNDCNDNVIPDECETDCNADEIPDDCDIAAGTSADADSNGIPDECEAPILYVHQAATGGNHGTNWTDAYTGLQSALRIAAAPGTAVTEIWVAAGAYRPDGGTGDRSLSFELISVLGIYGGFASGETDLAQRDPAVNVCVLSGDLDGDDGPDLANNGENSYHVVTGGGTDATAVLDGFIVTGGNADGDDFPHFNGGGILNDDGSPTVTRCAIVGNCAIVGGGLYNDEGAPVLTNCALAGNRATSSGGGFYTVGSAAHPLLEQCTFSGNTAGSDGGGLYNIGGGADVTLINCSLARNTAGAHGGGVRSFYAGVTTLTNCILWSNTDGGPTDQSAQIKVDGTIAAVVNHTCIQYLTGGLGGTGNISGDPWLIDPDGPDNVIGTADDNLRRGAGSACTDAGDNSAASQPTDADDRPRFVDDPMAPDIGVGTPPLVDMGPYEYQEDCNTNGIIDSVDLDAGTSQDCNQSHVPDECETISGGDFDGDGDVGLVDFAALADCLAGPEATPDPQLPECVPACLNAFDFEPDGDVDLGDFVEFQQAFAEP